MNGGMMAAHVAETVSSCPDEPPARWRRHLIGLPSCGQVVEWWCEHEGRRLHLRRNALFVEAFDGRREMLWSYAGFGGQAKAIQIGWRWLEGRGAPARPAGGW